jgi:hypothetical protein
MIRIATRKEGEMPRYEGILSAIVKEARALFKQRLHSALSAKYGDAFIPGKDDEPDKLPHGEFAAIGKACGVTPINARLWIKGKVFPDDAHIGKLAAFFEMDVKKFLGKELFQYYGKKEGNEQS